MDITYTKDGVNFGDKFISLQDIRANINKVKIDEGNLALLTMSLNGYRGFDGVIEQIVLPLDKIERMMEIMDNKYISFGEIAGKHSEVYLTFDEDNYDISTDENQIKEFLNSNSNGHTYNHSFLDKFHDMASDGAYDDMDDETFEEFKTLY